jgi:hypothetical protein
VRAALLRPLALVPLLFCLTESIEGQIPASFGVTILGYLLDNDLHAIRPIVGIPGNSRIDSAIDLGVPVQDAAFPAGQKHAIVVSPQAEEVLLVDLEDLTHPRRIVGAPSSISMIRTSVDGTKAALYDSKSNQLFIVSGIPNAAAVVRTVDVSLDGAALTRFAISNDGAVALLAFRGEESDVLYSWESTAGRRFVTTVSRVSDIAFVDGDAVVTDSGSDQVLLIRGVRNQASPALIADSKDGISRPAAVSISSRHEIYIGVADAVIVMDASGHLLRRVPCDCTVTMMMPLRDAAFRLTGPLDRPLLVLDGRTDPERVFFIPALTAEARGLTP